MLVDSFAVRDAVGVVLIGLRIVEVDLFEPVEEVEEEPCEDFPFGPC